LDYSTSVPSSGRRPFYGTIWFNLLATVAVIAVLLLIADSAFDVGGRPMRATGQFGVVFLAAYWVLIFPKLRKIRRNPSVDAKS
jgi:hypothetical protein